MQVLTPSGYVDIIDLNIGDGVIAYDINTGEQIINHLEGKTLWTPDMYPPDVIEGHYDQNGDWIPTEVFRTSYQVFQSNHGDWKYYKINGTWNLFKFQSVWVNMNIVHAPDLQIGDVIYNDSDGDIVITSIEEIDTPLSWWKLDVSGDSSFIADGLTLHNASRYWVGGGSSTNWNATANTNWSATSGGANNASVPTSADIAFFDGLGNSNAVISAITTIGGLIIASDYTATITHNFDLTVAGSITLGANYTIAGTAALRISAACTFTSNGKTWPNSLQFSTSTTTTLVGNLTINGLWTTVNPVSPIINSTTTETLTCGGGIFFENNCVPTGTAKHIITGGTLNTNAGYGGFGLPLDIAGNITLLTFVVQSKPVNYISGVVTTTGSIFYVGGGSTLNLSGISFNNFTKGGPATVGGTTTMTSNIVVNGLLRGAGTFNRTGSETITCNGGITADNNSFQGTVELVAKGGTITTIASTYSIDCNLTIDGNVTFAGNVLYFSGDYGVGSTLKYLSGTTNAASTTLYTRRASSIDTSGISWGAFVRNMAFNSITTLISNLNVAGETSILASGPIDTSTSAKLITRGLILSTTQSGSATIELSGGAWRGNFAVSHPFIFNGSSVISGSVQYGGSLITYTSGSITSSAANLTFTNSTQTLALSGSNINVPMTFAGGTKTLSTNFDNNALVTISGATIVNRVVSQSFNINGGLTVNAGLSGTATVVLSSGSWSGASTVTSNLTFNGNPTISGNVYYSTGTLSYISGTPIVTGSTLNLTGNCTLNTSTMAWNNISFNAVSTIVTLTSNLVTNGALVTNGGGSNQINKTTSETVTTFGGISVNAGALAGTALLYFNGGTWSGAFTLGISTTINGNVTLSSGAIIYAGNTFTYLSGTVNATGNIFKIESGATTLNTNGMLFNNFQIQGNSGTITLTSDLYINGTLQLFQTIPFNKTNNEKVIINDGIFYNSGYEVKGTALFYLQGGTITTTGTSRISPSNFYFNGNITLNGTINCSGGILTYLSGNLNTNNGTIAFDGYNGTSTVIDFHKCPIRSAIITTGQTVIMNEFFTGTPTRPAAISASTALGQYTVTFTDSFEKIGKNVVVTGCVPSRPLQLVLPYTTRTSAIKTTNQGIRYTNQSPNSISRDSKINPQISPIGLLVSDPNFKVP
jgi:hypothetical protein